MKKMVALLLTIIMVFGLVACGSDGKDVTPPDTGNESVHDEEGKTEDNEAPTDGVTLTVYTPQADSDRGPWIEEHAEAALGCDVELLCATGGELAERLRAEKANPQADVIMGLVQTAMYQLKDEEMLIPYTPSWAETLPEAYKDPEGYFYSFWQTPIIIGYNPEFITNPPTCWADLAKDEYKGKYVIPNTSSQTSRTYILGLLWPYYDEATDEISEEGWDLLRQIFENMYTLPASSETDLWKLFKDGTLPMTLNWFGGAKNKSAENEAPIEYVTPENGTPVVAEGIGIVAGTDQEELAQQFVEWWGDPDTMAAYANEFGQAPAHPDAIAQCNEEVKADAEMFTAQLIDWGICAKHMDDWFVKIELEIMP